jgi:hypothetical protein
MAEVGILRTRLPLAEPDRRYLAPRRSATRPLPRHTHCLANCWPVSERGGTERSPCMSAGHQAPGRHPAEGDNRMAESMVPALVAKRRWIGFDPVGAVRSRARRGRLCPCVANELLNAIWARGVTPSALSQPTSRQLCQIADIGRLKARVLININLALRSWQLVGSTIDKSMLGTKKRNTCGPTRAEKRHVPSRCGLLPRSIH